MVKTLLRTLAIRYNRITGPYVAQLRPVRQRLGLLNPSREGRTLAGAVVKLAVIGALAAFTFIAGLGAGALAEHNGVPAQLARKFAIEQRLATAANTIGLRPSDTQRAEWRPVVLNQHTLEWSSIRVRPAGVRGGTLSAAGEFLIFTSPLGRFAYLSPRNELHALALQAPTNVEAIRDTALAEHPLFSASEFRVHDILTREIAPGRWELYASLSRFEAPGCYQFKVVRQELIVRGDQMRVATPSWSDIYTARPGCIPDKDHGWMFQGMEAGGRMVFAGADTMLVSVGDHQFDGYNSTQRAAMDPAWDLGKIIEINLTTRATRIYASGLRNPQGLVVMRDGRIFSTEHGPQGGDEINFIRDGANYGWPLVSYGVNYGFPRSNWPTDPHPGGHSGYTRPAFAFVPAIGINNLVQPDPREFPNWADNDLLLVSLRAGMLFHVAVHEGDVAYVEPIDFNQRMLGPERLRDITTLADGRHAILTDSGRIIFLRNADLHADEPRTFVVRGYSNLTGPAPEEMFVAGASSEQRGRQYFQISCASCHSLDGTIGAGPPLNGIYGRDIASFDGFSYSLALRRTRGAWTERTLRSFITNPTDHLPGTSMPSPGISWGMAPEIVDYLRTTEVSNSEPARDSVARQDVAR